MKHAIFGDVGGHLGPFISGLRSVGVVPETATIPSDLIVVQVGDLIHKGPDSEGVVSLVDRMARANPTQWIQLAGNHELQYLVGTRRIGGPIDPHSAAVLRELHEDGLVIPSYAFSSGDNDYLITHAGLTQPFHQKMGGGDAHSVSQNLNMTEWNELGKPGTMLYGIEDFEAGIFWAEGPGEVYSSWFQYGEKPPFHQIHGHSTIRIWKPFGAILREHYGEWLTLSTETDWDRRHICWKFMGAEFWSIDNGFEKEATSDTIHPLIR